MAFTEEESKIALTHATNGAMFMFRADDQLRNEILAGGPSIKGLPEFIQMMIMKRDWINIDSEMVVKYCKGTLDSRNKYLFDKGDIKVIPEPGNVIKIS